jgi:hypothetical protein
MLILVNLTSYLLIYVHRWFGFVSKIEFCCFSTQIGIGMEALDYRGPIGVILFNHSNAPITSKRLCTWVLTRASASIIACSTEIKEHYTAVVYAQMQ